MIKKIIEQIDSFGSNELVNLNNTYCYETDQTDDLIHSNDTDFFDVNFSGKIMEAVRAVSYGDYNYMHDYVKFNGYGNLVTMDSVNVEDLCESVDIIAEHVAENFKCYDHLFDIEDDEPEEITDEDDDTYLEP
jgi:hypothetical protein